MDNPEVLQRLLMLLLLLLLRGWLALLPLLLLLSLPLFDVSDYLPEGCPIYYVLLMLSFTSWLAAVDATVYLQMHSQYAVCFPFRGLRC